MKARNLKALGIVVLIVVLAGVAARAGKDEAEFLPEAVKSAINAEYSGAEIEEAQAEEECITVYEVELEMGEQEVELVISADGKIMEKEAEVPLGEVPAAVKSAIEKACEGGEIKEVTKEVTYWVVTLSKLEMPKTTYEAEVVKDGKEMEIEVAADGTILEQEDEYEDEDEYEIEDEDEYEEEEEDF
jgi:hypothetical protein